VIQPDELAWRVAEGVVDSACFAARRGDRRNANDE
jgi:hypothetical protein